MSVSGNDSVFLLVSLLFVTLGDDVLCLDDFGSKEYNPVALVFLFCKKYGNINIKNKINPVQTVFKDTPADCVYIF